MSEYESQNGDRTGRLPPLLRFKGIRRRLIPVRQFGRDIPRMWSLHHTATLPRWPDRLPASKLRYRLRPTRGTVGGYSDAHYSNFTVFRRLKCDA